MGALQVVLDEDCLHQQHAFQTVVCVFEEGRGGWGGRADGDEEVVFLLTLYHLHWPLLDRLLILWLSWLLEVVGEHFGGVSDRLHGVDGEGGFAVLCALL